MRDVVGAGDKQTPEKHMATGLAWAVAVNGSILAWIPYKNKVQIPTNGHWK